MNTFNHKRVALAVALLGTFAAQAALACKMPVTPKSLPEGRTADVVAMTTAKRAVEQYVEQVFVYTSCENDSMKLQEVMAKQKALMDRFNAQVRAFNTQARAMTVANRN